MIGKQSQDLWGGMAAYVHNRETSIFRLWFKPLLCLRYPAVIWASTTYGVALGFFVLIQTANAVAFPALYNYSVLGVGNLSIAVRFLDPCDGTY